VGGQQLAGIATDGGVTVGGALPVCIGDCNGDEVVTVDELLTGINIALGAAATAVCESLDVNRDAAVRVDELLQGIEELLVGCPYRPELRRSGD
jgi:hypothetical protein